MKLRCPIPILTVIFFLAVCNPVLGEDNTRANDNLKNDEDNLGQDNPCAGDLMALRYHSVSKFERKRLYENYYSYEFSAPLKFHGLPYFTSYLSYFEGEQEIMRVPLFVENTSEFHVGFLPRGEGRGTI